jgi:enoyl-[acyl-carrier protein] reductase II
MRLLGITHPIVLGEMGSATSVGLVTAVSNAGGLGILGATLLSPVQIHEQIAAIRAATAKPFGANFLLFVIEEVEASFAAALEARPPVVSFAWARPDQDLRAYVQRVHEAGLLACIWPARCPKRSVQLRPAWM